jgi:hypothetical protein
LAARERELFDTSYFHVVFTVPHELNVLALENPRLFYDLLFTASAQTLLEIASDPKHLGAEIGVIAGFLANRFRASRLALGRQLLASNRSTPEEVPAHEFRSESSSLWHCPRCGASMMVIQRFTAAELSACMYFDSS